MGPLAGVKIIEFAGLGAAPFAAMLLSDLGADVVTVHRPEPSGVPKDALAQLTSAAMSRGRRSIAVDLKDPAGRDLLLDLLSGADGLIEGFRPGSMERLGLGPGPCLERNPRLVYGRMTGWGQEGPLAAVAGHDLNYLAVAGVLHHVGRRNQPPVVPLNLIGDFGGGGLLLAFGMVAAMLEAARSGTGQVVDTAMVDGAALLMTMMYEMASRGLWDPERGSNMNDGGAHFYQVYETADGKYVSIAAMEPKFYGSLLGLVGLSDASLPDQWDRSAWPALQERLAEVFRTRTRSEWVDLLEGTDACFAPVLSMTEAPDHPHNRARSTFVEVDGMTQPAPAPRFSRTPALVARGGAQPGQHTEEILREAGISDAHAADLLARGVVVAREPADTRAAPGEVRS